MPNSELALGFTMTQSVCLTLYPVNSEPSYIQGWGHGGSRMTVSLVVDSGLFCTLDVQDFLGQAFCTLGEIVGSPGSRLEKSLT